jgi:hypothetical protein
VLHRVSSALGSLTAAVGSALAPPLPTAVALEQARQERTRSRASSVASDSGGLAPLPRPPPIDTRAPPLQPPSRPPHHLPPPAAAAAHSSGSSGGGVGDARLADGISLPPALTSEARARADSQRSTTHPLVTVAGPGDFRHLPVTERAWRDHVPDRYLLALRQLVEVATRQAQDRGGACGATATSSGSGSGVSTSSTHAPAAATAPPSSATSDTAGSSNGRVFRTPSREHHMLTVAHGGGGGGGVIHGSGGALSRVGSSGSLSSSASAATMVLPAYPPIPHGGIITRKPGRTLRASSSYAALAGAVDGGSPAVAVTLSLPADGAAYSGGSAGGGGAALQLPQSPAPTLRGHHVAAAGWDPADA